MDAIYDDRKYGEQWEAGFPGLGHGVVGVHDGGWYVLLRPKLVPAGLFSCKDGEVHENLVYQSWRRTTLVACTEP